jgi:hypothetical protein
VSDDPKETLARLKRASKALAVAQKASKKTVREVTRAKRSVAKLKKQTTTTLPMLHKIKKKSRQERTGKKR